ncbi:Seven-in-absentia protein [Theobroma cacao]|nr:Seven-in-absentia protein [Theobroma cacao]
MRFGISCFGQHFCLHFEAFQLGMAPVYIAFLRFRGDDNEAKNYSYSLEVGGNGRKMTWQGVPRSIRDNHRKVRDSLMVSSSNVTWLCSSQGETGKN